MRCYAIATEEALETAETKASTLTVQDGTQLSVFCWLPAGEAKAAVQLVHGLAEHARRYARLAAALNAAGFAAYACDLRGHGLTARKPEELGLLAERQGWRKCLDDLWSLNARIVQEQPGLPIFLLGHSMGSSLVAQMICERCDSLAGAVLSAAGGKPTALAQVGRFIARLERLRLGPRGKSKLVQSLTFDSFNKRFEPARTRFDWLSRDPVEVDKYISDPLCGFPACVQLWIDLLDGWVRGVAPRNWRRIPKALPIYFLSGTHDPVSAGTKQLRPLVDEWRAAGLQVESRFYPQGRHEMLNDINRDEVTKDLLAWLGRALLK
ncbi:MAG TPA: alpha/beta hydrolase [Terriglobales bacterium]|nr:alpha/beta hydrolase [Terriglobales bacterium]